MDTTTIPYHDVRNVVTFAKLSVEGVVISEADGGVYTVQHDNSQSRRRIGGLRREPDPPMVRNDLAFVPLGVLAVNSCFFHFPVLFVKDFLAPYRCGTYLCKPTGRGRPFTVVPSP